MSNTSLELAVRTQNAVTEMVERVQTRLSEERGQTAAEYMGLILLVAAVVGLLLTSNIKGEIKSGITNAIADIKKKG